jgi:hypothetical protein
MYNIQREIKILRKLRYRTIPSEVCTILTILTILSTIYRQFSFLGTILAASVDVSTTKFNFRELFLLAQNSRNPWIRIRRFIFYSATISYISQPTYLVK